MNFSHRPKLSEMFPILRECDTLLCEVEADEESSH